MHPEPAEELNPYESPQPLYPAMVNNPSVSVPSSFVIEGNLVEPNRALLSDLKKSQRWRCISMVVSGMVVLAGAAFATAVFKDRLPLVLGCFYASLKWTQCFFLDMSIRESKSGILNPKIAQPASIRCEPDGFRLSTAHMEQYSEWLQCSPPIVNASTMLWQTKTLLSEIGFAIQVTDVSNGFSLVQIAKSIEALIAGVSTKLYTQALIAPADMRLKIGESQLEISCTVASRELFREMKWSWRLHFLHLAASIVTTTVLPVGLGINLWLSALGTDGFAFHLLFFTLVVVVSIRFYVRYWRQVLRMVRVLLFQNSALSELLFTFTNSGAEIRTNSSQLRYEWLLFDSAWIENDLLKVTIAASGEKRSLFSGSYFRERSDWDRAAEFVIQHVSQASPPKVSN